MSVKTKTEPATQTPIFISRTADVHRPLKAIKNHGDENTTAIRPGSEGRFIGFRFDQLLSLLSPSRTGDQQRASVNTTEAADGRGTDMTPPDGAKAGGRADTDKDFKMKADDWEEKYEEVDRGRSGGSGAVGAAELPGRQVRAVGSTGQGNQRLHSCIS